MFCLGALQLVDFTKTEPQVRARNTPTADGQIEKVGVSRCCAVLCMKAILLSPTRELAVQSAKVLCFEYILLWQINLQSLPNVSSVCMNAWTGTPNKALDLKHVQNLNSNTNSGKNGWKKPRSDVML